jgi:predicted Zn finger-like uncharacterized protein
VIVACPACETRYQVAEAALAHPAGRTVRCANCGHSWRHTGREPLLHSGPAAAPRPEPVAGEPSASPRLAGGVTLIAAAVILLFAAVAFAGVVYRGRVLAWWPPAAHLYALAGLAGPPPGAGLEIRKVVPSRTGDGLVIDGEIVNTIKNSRMVPRLRVALRDASGKELTAKIVDPPKRRLEPGETEHFETPFDHPGAATGVVVTFAPG